MSNVLPLISKNKTFFLLLLFFSENLIEIAAVGSIIICAFNPAITSASLVAWREIKTSKHLTFQPQPLNNFIQKTVKNSVVDIKNRSSFSHHSELKE
jgi:hypothetical protein